MIALAMARSLARYGSLARSLARAYRFRRVPKRSEEAGKRTNALMLRDGILASRQHAQRVREREES